MAATRTTQRTPHSTQKPKQRTRTPTRPPEPSDVKNHITSLLRDQGALTRGEITSRTGIPRTTVYDTLMNLLISGTVEKYVERNGKRGRPSVFYQLVA